MPRAARIVIPRLPHLVFQRGQGHRDVFRSDADRTAYLDMLQQQAARYGVNVLGYCLMNDHVYLVVLPRTGPALAQAVGRTHWLYSQYAARRRGASDALWQNRFFSCALDEAHLTEVLAFVERGPVRARISRYPWAYRWSSAPAHSNGTDTAGFLDMDAWRQICKPAQWRTLLVEPEVEAEADQIRRCLSTGRPLATEATLIRLERRLGRRLRALPVGRPRKALATSQSTRARATKRTLVKAGR